MSAKLVPTFKDRGVSKVWAADPYGRILVFLDRHTNIHTSTIHMHESNGTQCLVSFIIPYYYRHKQERVHKSGKLYRCYLY
jgi:hypothetical protein